MIRAVFFDLDGTLVDSAPELTAGVNGLMKVVRLRPFSVEEVSRMVGKGVRVLIERVCDARGIFPTDQTVSLMMREYAKIMSELDMPASFYAGAIEGVDLLKAKGFKVVLVTNKLRSMTEQFLERNDIATRFDALVCGDDTPHPKPAPDMIALACSKVEVDPQYAVMVGDSANDALAARAAHVRAVLVKTGYNEGIPIEAWAKAHGFDCVFDDAAQVCAEITAGRLRL